MAARERSVHAASGGASSVAHIVGRPVEGASDDESDKASGNGAADVVGGEPRGCFAGNDP